MTPAGLSSSPMPSTHDSCCTKVQKCLCDKETTQSAKIAFWSLGGMVAATLIPVPFVNGLVVGSMLFMSGHEMAQHPDSVCIRGLCRPIAQSRTWKHITAGAAISGIGWGLGSLALVSNIPIVMSLGIGFGTLGGIALGFKVAYSNSVFAGQPRPDDGQLLVEESPSFDYNRTQEVLWLGQ